MNKKSDYISPEVDVFTLLSEGVVCQSTTGNAIDPGIPDPDWGLL